MKPMTPAARTWILIPVVLMMLAARARAVDPLPPELENAPLKAQAAWREKMGRESQEERTQAAQKRFDERMVFKQGLMAQVHREAADRRDAVLSPVPEPLPVVESEVVSARERNIFIVIASLIGFGYLVRRHLQDRRAVKA